MPAGCTVNLNARLYDPSIGKFMAADSIIPDAFDGQSYNRYAYVTNNPLSFTDVTGHYNCGEGCEGVTVNGYSPPPRVRRASALVVFSEIRTRHPRTLSHRHQLLRRQ